MNVLLVIAAVLFLGVPCMGVMATTHLMTRPPWHLPVGWAAANRDPLTDLGLPYTAVEFPQSAEGGGDERLTLRGWLVPGDRRAFLRHTGAIFHPAGLDTLLFDCAGHGLSDARRPWPLSTWPGRALSWGTREHADVAGAVAWARRSGYERVVVVATSQGAASTLIAAARAAGARLAPPPRSWWAALTGWGRPEEGVVLRAGPPGGGGGGRRWADALILENPFSRQESLAAHVAGMVFARLFRWPIVGPPRLALRRAWVRLAVALSMWRTGNVGRRRLRPLDMVPAVRLPMLFMHGTGDTLVPHSHSVELVQAAGGDAGAAHGAGAAAAAGDGHAGSGSGSGLDSDGSRSSGSDGDGGGAGGGGKGSRRAPRARARLWLAKGAGHTLLFDAYPNEYARQVLNFLEDVAPPPAAAGGKVRDGEVASPLAS